MKNNYLLFFFISISQIAFSQSKEKLIQVKVIADGGDVSGINIVNLVNEKSAVSDAKGQFEILAKATDLLVFSSDKLEPKRRLIEEEDIKSGTINVVMIPKIGQLEEVVIVKYRDIKLEDVGITPARKHFTPAERKLYTAGDFKPIHLLGLLAGSLQVDPILNAINGRTSRLKKEIDLEQKEFRLEEINTLYSDEFYTEKLKIPKDYILGFKYYLNEDEDFATLMESKNVASLEMHVIRMGENFVKLISNDSD